MLGLAELARAGTTLDERSIDHLQRLVAAWALPADLSLADLVLYAPVATDSSAYQPSDDAFLVLAHVRSTTAPTVHLDDPVGTRVSGSSCRWLRNAIANGIAGETQIAERVPAAGRCRPPNPSQVVGDTQIAERGPAAGQHQSPNLSQGAGATRIAERGPAAGQHQSPNLSRVVDETETQIVRRGPGPVNGDDNVVQEEVGLPLHDQTRVVSFVPVRCAGHSVAVLAREAPVSRLRLENPLESVYRGVYQRFARMISDGTFPYDRMERIGEFREPRVSDGVLLHDREGRVTYASPNAVSALHRLGVVRSVIGSRLREFGLDDTVIRRSFWRRRSTVAEFDIEPQTTVVLRSYPLLEDTRVTGAVALLHDISELKHRDRLLVSKDATIREIHHRVKNNLQTVSSLLELQARRLRSTEAKAALESSVRRISSIAMVHEHLSLDTTSEVDFDGLVAPLLGLVQEGLTAADRPLVIRVEGMAGSIDGEVAMPLAVVLVELTQNALQHGPAGQQITVRFARTAEMLTVSVTDQGPGVSEGFSLDRDAGLGLTIVRTFVVHHLGGAISIRAASADSPRGAVVDIAVPRRAATATIG